MRNLPFFIALSLCSGLVYADFPKPTWCDKAKTYPEKTVCDDDGLSASAIALENRWKAYRETHTESEIALAKTGLNDWNKDPFQKCENKDCIRAAYTRVQSESWYQGVVEPSSSDDSAKTAIPGNKASVDKSLFKILPSFDLDIDAFNNRFADYSRALKAEVNVSVELNLKSHQFDPDYEGESYTYRTGQPDVFILVNTNASGKVVNASLAVKKQDDPSDVLPKYMMAGTLSIAKTLDVNLSDKDAVVLFKKLLNADDGDFDNTLVHNGIQYKTTVNPDYGFFFVASKQ